MPIQLPGFAALTVLTIACRVYASPVLQGYDVVEYFNLAKANEHDKDGVLGISTYACRLRTYDLSGGGKRPFGLYEFWFSTADNVALFQDDPWKYAPKYGGFCSWGVATEVAPFWPWSKDHMGPPAQPWDAWRVYNGGLYMNYLQSIRTSFFASAEKNIALADKRWVELYGGLEAGPFNFDCQSPICFSLPQPLHDISHLPLDTPDVQCTTSGFQAQLNNVVKLVGTTQLMVYKGHERAPSFLGGSGDSSILGGSDGGNPLPEDPRPESSDASLLGGSATTSDAESMGGVAVETSPLYPGQSGADVEVLRGVGRGSDLVRPALMGYDVVAYFDIGPTDEGVKGHPKYACHLATYDQSSNKKRLIGVYEFWFANKNNMKKFKTDPWRYAPRYGGFCSWGIATELEEQGWPWTKIFLGPPGQPWDGWTVHEDGGLYINYWPSIADSFFSDSERNIGLGNERWKGWWGDLKAGPFNTHCPNAACVQIPQNLSPPCPKDAICTGDIPEISCVVRKSVGGVASKGDVSNDKISQLEKGIGEKERNQKDTSKTGDKELLASTAQARDSGKVVSSGVELVAVTFISFVVWIF